MGEPTPIQSVFDAVQIAVDRMDPVIRCTYMLLSLDPSLGARRERHRLRLLADRLLNTVDDEALGQALTDLHQMHDRAFPVRAFDTPDAPRASRTDAAVAFAAFRCRTGRALADARHEVTRMAITLDFLESESSGVPSREHAA